MFGARKDGSISTAGQEHAELGGETLRMRRTTLLPWRWFQVVWRRFPNKRGVQIRNPLFDKCYHEDLVLEHTWGCEALVPDDLW